MFATYSVIPAQAEIQRHFFNPVLSAWPIPTASAAIMNSCLYRNDGRKDRVGGRFNDAPTLGAGDQAIQRGR
jgi:hypothetical protein